MEQKVKALLNDYRHNNFKKVGLPTLSGISFVPIEEITRCEADGSYTKVFLAKNKKEPILVSKKLKDFEQTLPVHSFLRIHRSHLINLNYVVRYDKTGYLVMEDGVSISIPRRRRDYFTNLITSF